MSNLAKAAILLAMGSLAPPAAVSAGLLRAGLTCLAVLAGCSQDVVGGTRPVEDDCAFGCEVEREEEDGASEGSGADVTSTAASGSTTTVGSSAGGGGAGGEGSSTGVGGAGGAGGSGGGGGAGGSGGGGDGGAAG